jgi:hypothetical protein
VSARAHHPGDLRQGAGRIEHVLDRVVARHDVERSAGEGELLGVGDDRVDRARVAGLVTGQAGHRVGDVTGDGDVAGARERDGGHGGRAAAEIQHARAARPGGEVTDQRVGHLARQHGSRVRPGALQSGEEPAHLLVEGAEPGPIPALDRRIPRAAVGIAPLDQGAANLGVLAGVLVHRRGA